MREKGRGVTINTNVVLKSSFTIKESSTIKAKSPYPGSSTRQISATVSLHWTNRGIAQSTHARISLHQSQLLSADNFNFSTVYHVSPKYILYRMWSVITVESLNDGGHTFRGRSVSKWVKRTAARGVQHHIYTLGTASSINLLGYSVTAFGLG